MTESTRKQPLLEFFWNGPMSIKPTYASIAKTHVLVMVIVVTVAFLFSCACFFPFEDSKERRKGTW
jgi:hypothetical protein